MALIPPPQPVYTAAEVPNKQLAASTSMVGASNNVAGTLPTGAPTLVNTNTVQLEKEAHGRVPDCGLVTVEVSGACTVTLWIFSPASGNWRNPGVSGSVYTKVFTGAAMDYFVAAPGSYVYLQSSAGSINCWTNLVPAQGYHH